MTEKRFTVTEEVYQDTDDMGYAIASLLIYYYVSNDEIGFNFDDEREANRFADYINQIIDENEQLKSENQRLTDKLNQTALELVDDVISQGKASEISEMSYNDFLDYRAKNGKPMELRK